MYLYVFLTLSRLHTELDADRGGPEAEAVEVVDVRSILYPELRSILRAESVPVISISEAIEAMTEEGSFFSAEWSEFPRFAWFCVV